MRRLAIGAAAVLLSVTGCSGRGHDAAAPAANRHLVYVAGQDPSQAGVWLADVDGSHARRLGPGSVAVLTPDGKTVAVRRPGGIYLVSTGGKVLRRLTRDGTEAFPVWGPSGIAYSNFPGGGTIEDCSAPGIWTMSPDGSNVKPLIERAPSNLAGDGLYGLQPLAWLDGNHILTGIRSDGGNQGAVLDTKSGKLRRLPDYADEASSDGRFVVGSGNDVRGVHLAIYGADGHRVYLRKDACCPDWNR